MIPRPTILERLARFRQRDLFSAADWQAHGLTPSSTDLSRELTVFFHDCAEALADAISFGRSPRHLKELLTTALAQLDKARYNAGEREFIGGLFHELAAIVEVDIHRAINRWCYGPLLLQPLMRLLHPRRRVVGTHSHS